MLHKVSESEGKMNRRKEGEEGFGIEDTKKREQKE